MFDGFHSIQGEGVTDCGNSMNISSNVGFACMSRNNDGSCNPWSCHSTPELEQHGTWTGKKAQLWKHEASQSPDRAWVELVAAQLLVFSSNPSEAAPGL